MSLSVGCHMFAAGRFFIAVTANVGRQALGSVEYRVASVSVSVSECAAATACV